MLRRVDWYIVTDVSEERTVSIFRVYLSSWAAWSWIWKTPGLLRNFGNYLQVNTA